MISATPFNSSFRGNKKIFGSEELTDSLKKSIGHIRKIMLSSSYTVNMKEDISLSTKSVKIETIEIEGIVLQFKESFFLNYHMYDNYFCYEYKNLNYYGMGSTLEEMISAFKEDIYADWMMYVENSDVILSNRAKILRNKLINLLQRI